MLEMAKLSEEEEWFLWRLGQLFAWGDYYLTRDELACKLSKIFGDGHKR